MEIRPVQLPVPGLDTLATEAREEGYRFVDRLAEDWSEGTNRFSEKGERLLGAFDGEHLVAVGGLNRDPYDTRARLGRIRRFYVLSAYRRKGVGRALLSALLDAAQNNFRTIRLRTDDERAARFYQSCGFKPSKSETATHELTFG